MIEVIYEAPEFLVINKPAGVLVHQTAHLADGEEETIVDWILKRYPEILGVGDKSPGSKTLPLRPGIVHRLDKETSGVLLIAKTQGAFEELKSLFQTGGIKKSYKALLWGELRGRGVIDKPIGLKPGTVRRSVTAKNMKMIKSAETKYESLEVFKKDKDLFSLVAVFPKTGRTHQIRVHFQSIHHPLVGDLFYGFKKNPWNLKRQFLHAESLEFTWGQDGHKIRVEADLPEELKRILTDLEGHKKND